MNWLQAVWAVEWRRSIIFIIWPWDHPAIGSGFHRLIVRKQRLFPWWLLFANLHTTKVGFPGSTCSRYWHIHSLPPCPLSQWARALCTLNWARRVNWEIHANELIMFMMLIAHALVWPDGSRLTPAKTAASPAIIIDCNNNTFPPTCTQSGVPRQTTA